MSRTSEARHSKPVQVLGRAGMVCFGLVHLIVAYLAVRIVFVGSGQEADQRGAIAEVGSTAAGGVVLWALAVGLLAYGVWQGLMAATGYTWITDDKKRAIKKVASVARAVVGISLGAYTIKLVVGAGDTGSGDQQQQEFTAWLLSLPAGGFLVALLAVIVLGVAVAAVVKAVRKSFLDDLNLGELPSGTRKTVERLGRIGYTAKGVVFAVIGVLIGFTALNRDPQQSGGLDTALRTLADQPAGPVLLVAVALGLAAFGAYCFGAAWAHRR